jgi:hypothetical protein
MRRVGIVTLTFVLTTAPMAAIQMGCIDRATVTFIARLCDLCFPTPSA